MSYEQIDKRNNQRFVECLRSIGDAVRTSVFILYICLLIIAGLASIAGIIGLFIGIVVKAVRLTAG